MPYYLAESLVILNKLQQSAGIWLLSLDNVLTVNIIRCDNEVKDKNKIEYVHQGY